MDRVNYSFKSIGLWLIWLALGIGSTISIRLGNKQYDMSTVELVLVVYFTILIITCSFMIPPKTPLVLLCSFFIWTLFGVLGAENQVQSLALVLSVFYSIVAYILAYDYFQLDLEAYFKGLRVFSLLVAIQVIWVALTFIISGQDITYDSFKSVIRIPLGASNFLAIILEYGLMVEVCMRRRFWGLCSAIIFVAFILTFSKAGFMALLFGLILWLALNLTRESAKSTFFLLGVPLGFIYIFTNYTEYGRVYWEAVTGVTEAHSLYSRLDLWQQSVENFVSAPIMGTGLSWSDSNHNIFLQLLSNTGVVGLLLFVILLGTVYHKLIPLVISAYRLQVSFNTSPQTALTLAFTILLIHTTVEPFFFIATTQIWFGLFLAAVDVSSSLSG